MCAKSTCVDITGQRFGKLTAIERSGIQCGHATWLCKCECGNTIVASGNNLRRGITKSCHQGKCRENSGGGFKAKHGDAHSRLYNVWSGMKARCYNKNSLAYKNYGGRGIRICNEWLNDYAAFQKWALANGYDDQAPHGECTIDRINVNGDYEPSNCRFVSMAVQARNKRHSLERA